MRIAICEDHPEQRRELVDMLQTHDKEKRYRIKAFRSGDEMWFDYQGAPLPYDLIILDLELPGQLGGLDVARKIRELGDHVTIVILTAHSEYALEGYSVQPFHFLVKPVGNDRMLEIVDQAEKRMLRYYSQCLNLPEKGGYLRIPFNEVLYMESSDHHVFIQTKDVYYKRYCKLSELAVLCDERFLYPHKSYIINADWMKKVGDRYTKLWMEDGREIPISKHKKTEFIQALAQYDRMFGCLRA